MRDPNTFTIPCGPQEALDLAVVIVEKLRGDWKGEGGFKDGVNLGLAVKVLEAWYDSFYQDTPVTPKVD